jgi:hypothetical protein
MNQPLARSIIKIAVLAATLIVVCVIGKPIIESAWKSIAEIAIVVGPARHDDPQDY